MFVVIRFNGEYPNVVSVNETLDEAKASRDNDMKFTIGNDKAMIESSLSTFTKATMSDGSKYEWWITIPDNEKYKSFTI